MSGLNPVGYLVIPLAVLALRNRKHAALFVLGSLPFFAWRVGMLGGHNFTIPEVAIMTLMGALIIDVYQTGEVPDVPTDSLAKHTAVSTPLSFLVLFGGMCFLSVLLLVFIPPEIWSGELFVHPYESGKARFYANAPLAFSS